MYIREAQQIHFRPYHNELKPFYHKVFPHRLAGRFGISHFTAKMSTSEPCDFDYNFESSSTSHHRMYSLGSANSIPIQLETSPFLFAYLYFFMKYEHCRRSRFHTSPALESIESLEKAESAWKIFFSFCHYYFSFLFEYDTTIFLTKAATITRCCLFCVVFCMDLRKNLSVSYESHFWINI